MRSTAILGILRALSMMCVLALSPSCTKKTDPQLDPERVRIEMEKAHSAAHQAHPVMPGSPPLPPGAHPGLPPNPLLARGRAIYLTACISCHNVNPRLPGALGPEVYGASLPLLNARILTGTYPPGYKPKRASGTMAPLPHLRAEIPALHAFLNAP